MTLQFNYTILAETPAKKNNRINLRNGMSIPSKRYREWHKLATSQLLNFELPKSPIENDVEIKLNFTHGDLRRRDSDNGTSSIMDLLVDTKILQDDNWQIVKKITVTNDYEKNNPKCDIEIILI